MSRLGRFSNRPKNGDIRYDAFISYSHARDRDLATAIQVGVEKFAKPWNRIRALRIFRDKTSLSAGAGLWSAIEDALSRSSWFVLMASPEAAGSPWVGREIRWWLEHESARRLLVVVTGGELKWDANTNDFDWEISTALPPDLRGAFDEEPLWVVLSKSSRRVSRIDPELQDAIVDIAAVIRDIPKDDLVGVAVREHRRTMRLARGAQVGLAALLVVSIAVVCCDRIIKCG